MKTRLTTLMMTLAACGWLTLPGSRIYAEVIVYSLGVNEVYLAADDLGSLKGLKSDKEADKIKALDELAARGEKAAEAVKPIEDLLKDKSAKVRAHAAWALGAIGPAAKESVTALAQLLKDPDQAVRRDALRAIRMIHPGPKLMIPICVKLIEDSDSAIRPRILNTIADGGVESVPGLIEALKNEKAAFWALLILRDIGPAAKDAAPAITELLKDKRPGIRREAVLTLGALGEAAAPAVPQIAALLSDKHAQVAATFTLGELGQIPKDAEATVRANAKSDNQMLSTASLWALARVHPEDKDLRLETTEKLVARLKEKDPFVAAAAARALAALPPAPEITMPIWEKALKDADETTMHRAMDTLAGLGAPAVPRLIDALKYKKFRIEVIYALGRIGPAAAPATGELAKLVEDKNSHVAQEAIIALGDIGPGAKDAVPALTKVLEQPFDRDMNFAPAAFALGKIGPAAASADSALLKQLQSKDDNVRLLSAWALAQIHPASAEIAAKVVPVSTSGLALPDLEDRLLSAEALGGFGPLAKSAVDALKKVSTDANKDLQEASAKALKAVEKTVATAAAAATATATAAAAAVTPLKPGDFVFTVEQVKIGVKGKLGEMVPAGTKLKVFEIRGPWVGVQIDAKKDKTGWLRGEQVSTTYSHTFTGK